MYFMYVNIDSSFQNKFIIFFSSSWGVKKSLGKSRKYSGNEIPPIGTKVFGADLQAKHNWCTQGKF